MEMYKSGWKPRQCWGGHFMSMYQVKATPDGTRRACARRAPSCMAWDSPIVAKRDVPLLNAFGQIKPIGTA